MIWFKRVSLLLAGHLPGETVLTWLELNFGVHVQQETSSFSEESSFSDKAITANAASEPEELVSSVTNGCILPGLLNPN